MPSDKFDKVRDVLLDALEVRRDSALRAQSSEDAHKVPQHDLAIADADEAASPAQDKYFSVQGTLNERERLYGNIEDLMTLSQEIQGVMRASKNWWKLMPAQREALQMIASKLARILNGDPNYKDNWHDIQGYARLAEDRCKSSD